MAAVKPFSMSAVGDGIIDMQQRRVLCSVCCVRNAGGPYQLTARSSAGQTLAVDNVLIGEVWLVAGQSVSLLLRPDVAPCMTAALHPIGTALCSLQVLCEIFSRGNLR